MTSISLTAKFNEGIQFDLLFLDCCVTVHLICICICWGQGRIVPSRDTAVVLPAITSLWIRQYGPPTFIVSDQEGALFSDEGAIWASRWGIELRAKLKGAHAYIVERRS